MQSLFPFRSCAPIRRLSRSSSLAGALTLLGLLPIHAQAAGPAAASDTVLVRFKASVKAVAKTRVLNQIGGQIEKTYSTGWALAKVPNADAALKVLQVAPEVTAAEPNFRVQIPRIVSNHELPVPKESSVAASKLKNSKLPNDPYYPQMWNLEKIGAPQAWKTTTGSSDVVVAVMDSGVRATHEDLKDNLWTNQAELNGKPGVDDDNNGYVDDVYGWNAFYSNGDVNNSTFHGTFVSSIIGATGNNGKGMTGLNWKVKIVNVGVIDEAANKQASVNSILEGVDYLLKLKKSGVNVRAVNCSFGVVSDTARSAFDSFKALSDAGILIVAAAGNENQDNDVLPIYPTNFDLPNMISVGASTYADERLDVSNYGLETVDIFAPGRNLIFAESLSDNSYAGDGAGTSGSAPHVVGAAALLWAAQPNLSAQAVKERILASAAHIETLRPFVKDGKRLNLGALLDNAVHTISGTTLAMVGSTLQPVGGVRIFLDGNTKTPDAITDAQGKFTLAGIKGGAHKVRAQMTGMTFSGPVSVSLPASKAAAPKTVSVKFTAKSKVSRLYSVFGDVVQKIPNQENRPKEGVDVYLGESRVPFARTGADGKYKISGLVAGAYSVRFVDSVTGQTGEQTKVAYLPNPTDISVAPEAPDNYVKGVFAFQDNQAPVVYNTNIKDGDVFPLANAPTKYTGSIKDNVEVGALKISLVRGTPDYSTAEIYDGVTGTWKNYYDDPTLPSVIVAGEGRSQFDFEIPLPDYYVPGYVYAVYYEAVDAFGNASTDFPFFYLDDSSASSSSSTSTKASAKAKPQPADEPKPQVPSVRRS